MKDKWNAGDNLKRVIVSMFFTFAICAAAIVLNTDALIAGSDPAPSTTVSGTKTAKIKSNATLRAAMEVIRNAVVINHSLVTHRRMPIAQAHQFETDIRIQVDKIRASQDLSEAARLAIEPILKQLGQGVGAIAKSNTKISPMDGLLQIDEALASYQLIFDHPGWKGIQEL